MLDFPAARDMSAVGLRCLGTSRLHSTQIPRRTAASLYSALSLVLYGLRLHSAAFDRTPCNGAIWLGIRDREAPWGGTPRARHSTPRRGRSLPGRPLRSRGGDDRWQPAACRPCSAPCRRSRFAERSPASAG